ncbi:hypothetical protein A1O3_03174 [Capronia epimyces CBS 606.96]|uniref:Uncharacterized protein n=1 Tax=Capronia epimyces CBS 606.96 TaxID=1182542 RepID=W9YK94_9EURO|nr:uncharacterized protein A1O3_03174 [Capronia epimyces CBS 606.96]EXJ90105.1 hypothetical protein A1O3_03174 [Capronia epimyces CBS 606.96]
MSSSPGSWQDRRFMFPAGKEVHQGSRRFSQSSDKDVPPPVTAAAVATTADAAPAPPSLATAPADDSATAAQSTGQALPRWEGDRRFMFPAAKEIHQPARRMSSSSTSSGEKKAGAPTKPSTSPPASSGGGIAAAIAGRRRSSASSQGGLFGGLIANRSSDTHAERRQGWEEMKRPEGLGGFFSNLVNKSGEKK